MARRKRIKERNPRMWRAVAASALFSTEAPVYTEEEEARMIEKLRDLGYE